MAETRAKTLCRVEFPAHLETSYNDAVDERHLRWWLWNRYGVTVAGDIEISAESDGSGGWMVDIKETG